jgi:hypothetical protein
MLFRRLDDKIRELSAWALASQDPAELHEIVTQLRAALQKHINRIKDLAVNSSQPQRRAALCCPPAHWTH